jgi:CheY-like chemotaxis protein
MVKESNMSLKSVLVVEDDPALGHLLRLLLIANGFQVLFAETAEKALTLWIESGRSVRVALIDLNLPGEMNGDELVQRLKFENPALKIIVMSGSIPPYFESLAALHSLDLLQKPFLPAQLLYVIRQAFLEDFPVLAGVPWSER